MNTTLESHAKSGIIVDDLSFRYAQADRKQDIFRGFNCRFESNHISVVLGRSGCGKSTLLKLLCGLLTPRNSAGVDDDSRIHIAGSSPEQARRQHLLGYLPQDTQPAPWRTAKQNLQLALEMANGREKGHDALAAATLSRLDMSDYGERYPQQLSGGQCRRVAIAMAIVAGPSYLLLDEPFRDLDAVIRTATYRFLLDIWATPSGGAWSPTDASAGRGMLLITHDLDEAVLLGDRIYVMRDLPVSSLLEFNNPLKDNRSPNTLDDLRFDSQFRSITEELRGYL